MEKYKLRILEIVKESEDTRTFYLEKPQGFTWEEGAHAHFAIEGFDEGERPRNEWVRHMSIMTLPEEGKIGFTTRIPQEPSEYKMRLEKAGVGGKVVLFKLGNRMELRREERPVVLLSMGVGLATMRPLVLAYQKDPTGIPSLTSLQVDRSPDSLFRDVLASSSMTNFHHTHVPSRAAFQGQVNELLGLENPIWYLVGSDEFVLETIQHLRDHGVDDEAMVIDKKEMVRKKFFSIRWNELRLVLP